MEDQASTVSDRSLQASAHAALGEPGGKKGRLKRMLPFLGPAFVASVAYMDPGNFATNIEGGAKFGYMLLWVVLMSNLMGMLVQLLAAKVGIATGQNLAELCRDRLPRPIVWGLWVLMELVAMATDVAEFVGAALGFKLLLGVPLWAGGLLTAVATFLLLGVQRKGFRPLEAAITVFVGLVAACYIAEMFFAGPDWGEVARGLTTPRFAGPESIMLAAGILGATVMPHAIFLHSSLTQGRIKVSDPAMRKRLLRYELLDVLLAMGVAGMVNASMLIMAASAFFNRGQTDVSSIEQAHQTLPHLGAAAGVVFAISLVAAGLSSTVVGTISGQVMMQGFVRFHIPLIVRRLVTILPSVVVILAGFDVTRSLVISQVILSLALPFALVPLVWFTARRDLMGNLVNRAWTTLLAIAVTAVVVTLNLLFLARIFHGD